MAIGLMPRTRFDELTTLRIFPPGRTSFTRALGFGACLAALATLTGCPIADGGDDVDNGSFASASDLPFSNDGKAELTASRLSGDIVDFYKLGELSPGDSILIDVQTASGDLDPVLAVFDASENVLFFSDDREEDGSNLNPFLDATIFGETSEFFIGITAFPGSGTSGTYRMEVSIIRGGPAPQPVAQTIFLNWAGGRGVSIPNVGNFNLEPFSAADVGLPASNTDTLKDRVESVVKNRYANFDVIILNSDDHARPVGAHSTVYFGGFNRQSFAISEQVDSGNRDTSDDCIIFAESFNGAFSSNPSIDQMATGLGNTVAHEIGHLLGMVHTKQCSELMDTTCGNNSILVAQAFERAPIDDSVFPTGFQDSAELIGWLVGLAPL